MSSVVEAATKAAAADPPSAKRRGAGRGPRGKGSQSSLPGFAPADRRAIRQELQQRRSFAVGLDFDCTITTKHFYKTCAWGYFSGRDGCHEHYEELKDWLDENAPDVPHSLPQMLRPDPRCTPEVTAVCDFLSASHPDVYVRVMREFFLGGEARIAYLTKFFTEVRASGADLVILTAGIACGLMQIFADCVPEWLAFFPTSHIHDTSGSRHRVSTIEGLKMLILRDITPKTGFLVDDALARGGRPPEWICKATNVEPLTELLQYESGGLQPQHLNVIREKLGLSVDLPTECFKDGKVSKEEVTGKRSRLRTHEAFQQPLSDNDDDAST